MLQGAALRLIPERVLARRLPPRLRWDPEELPPPPSAPDAHVRLYIAPVNFAGQGWQWARAVTRYVEGAAAINMVSDLAEGFRHRADRVIPYGAYVASRRWQRCEFEAVASAFTHVMIEAERNPFGAPLDETCARQASRLRRRGVEVLMLCHGSDIRSPARHAAEEPESPFADELRDRAAVVEAQVRRNRRLLEKIGAPVLVSTPGLLAHVETARWLPVVVDPDAWAAPPSSAGEVPLVVHAPSKALNKGSAFVDASMTRLAEDGVIRYRRLTGVPHEEMPEAIRGADIVIDQLRLGDYGVAACEAMAAGRVVVGHVSAAVRTLVAERTGRELPIVEATARDLESVVRAIATDPEPAARIAGQGPGFVRAVHDGRLSADVLAELLV